METTTCYKCDTEIEVPTGSVHPICAECEVEFDAWFVSALKGGR